MILSRRSLFGLLATPLLFSPAFAQRGDRIAGYWRGRWTNSGGETGRDTLALTELRNGRLRGVWTDIVEVSGQRHGPDSASLTGKTSKRSYEIDLVVSGGNTMQLNYVARNLQNGATYSGQSTLRLSRGDDA
jgi:hypothetical protein